MRKSSTAFVLELPVPERLQLMEDIWNSIAEVPHALEVTEDEKLLINERLDAYHRNPSAGSPWEEVQARILSRK